MGALCHILEAEFWVEAAPLVSIVIITSLLSRLSGLLPRFHGVHTWDLRRL